MTRPPDGNGVAGALRRDADAVFHELTRSVCPVCLRGVDAQVLLRQNRVYLRKRCPDHGWFEGLISADAMSYAMARQAELVHCIKPEQPRVRRAVRCVTRDAAFGFDGCVLIREGTLLVSMTLNTRRVGPSCESRLFEFETTVWIVTIATLHRPFDDFVMEGCVELWFDFAVATET